MTASALRLSSPRMAMQATNIATSNAKDNQHEVPMLGGHIYLTTAKVIIQNHKEGWFCSTTSGLPLETMDGQMVLVSHIKMRCVQLTHYSRTRKEKSCPISQPISPPSTPLDLTFAPVTWSSTCFNFHQETLSYYSRSCRRVADCTVDHCLTGFI